MEAEATAAIEEDPLESTLDSTALDVQSHKLAEKFEAITRGHYRVQERFFAGSSRRRSASPTENGGEGSAVVSPDPNRHSRSLLSPLSPSSEGRASVDRPVRTTQVVFKIVDGRRIPVRMSAPIAHNAVDNVRSLQTQPHARWPEGFLMGPPPTHIYHVPEYREPFYTGTRGAPVGAFVSAAKEEKDPTSAPKVCFGRTVAGPVTTPKVLDPGFVESVVYCREDLPDSCFLGKVSTYTEDTVPLPPSYTLTSPTDTTLVFDSRFESGNLARATRSGQTSYDLLLETDLYTNKHTQWFYFSVQNMRKGKTYTFRINNLLKPDSLYNSGMQPVVYSKVREARDCVGWLRGGSHTRYYKNSVRVPFAKNERYFSTLTWKHVCDEDSDTVYFAHCYPYTYTDLQTYLTHMSQDRVRSAICRQRELCRTLAGNMCDLLTITEYGCSSEEMKLRKGIIVTARVHPGESNASWMMKGFLDFITSDHPDARMLRRCFIFKVVPMLNPDGVIAGNYRTSLAGVDLNRVYNKSNRELYPTINALKLAMKRLQQDRAVLLYVDLHGHSRKQNVFMYGCNNAQRPAFMQRERVFPKMLSLNGPSYFHYKECRFNVKANKESTGRVNTWRELGLLNAFTLEATFCGSTLGELRHSQFNCRDFERMGEILCDTILDYCDPNSAKKAKILLEIRATPTMNTDGGDDDSSAEGSPGSDSSDSNGETELAEIRFKSHALKNVGGLSFAGEAAIVALTSPPPPELSAASRGKTKAKLKSKKDRDSLRAAADKQTVLSSPSSKFKDEAMSDEPSGTQDGKSKKLRGSRSFVSKFNGRGGSGIPSFTEEQAAERRRLKLLRQEAPGGGGSGATLGGCSSVVGSPSLGSPGMADDSGELGFDGGSGGGGGGNGRQGVSRARSNNTIIARYLAAVNTENCGSGGGRVSDGGGRATADPSPRRPERPVQDLQFLPTKSLDLDLPRPTGYRTVRNGNGSATSISNSSPPHHSVFVTAQPDLVQATLELLRQRVHDERRRSIGSPSSPEDWHRIKQRMQTSRQRISVTSPPTSPRQVPSTQFDLDTGLAASSETTAGGVPPTQTASFKPRPRRTSRTSIESDIDVGIEYLEERAKQRKQRQSLVSGIRDFELANLDTLDTVVIDPPPSDRPVPSRPGSGLEARRRGNGVSNRSRPWTATAGGRRTSWTNMSEPIASGSSLRAVHELRKSRSGGSATTTRPVCEQ